MKIEDINQYFNHSSIHVEPNYIQLVTHCNEYHKLSVVGETDQLKYSENIYHGIHPIISPILLKKFFKNKAILNIHQFWNEVKNLEKEHNHIKLCNLPSADSVIEFSFLGRAILRLAEHFSITLKINDTPDNLSCLINTIQNFKQDEHYFYSPYKFISFNLNNDVLTVKIKGFPPCSVINYFNDYLFIFNEKQKAFSNNIYGKSLKTFYEDENTFRMFNINGNYVFYSGVMPRVEQIKIEENNKDAPHILYVKLLLGRTTFLTVDCFDNPATLDHPYFKGDYIKYGDALYQFDCIEDVLQENYLYNKHHPTNHVMNISRLNTYLSKSFNTHTLAVSANITTSDDYLLVTKRSKGSIDSDTYYCSVNGQTEFYDANVSFYQNSVYEDLPTMHFDSPTRIDFTKEISREAIAELGLFNFESEWNIIGLSYLSINNSLRSIKMRRMHFNLMMENKTIQSFKEIYDRKELHTESFEHDDLLGYRTLIHNSKFLKIKSDLQRTVNWMLNQQIYSVPLITLVLIVYYCLIQSRFNLTSKTFSKIVNTLVGDGITWIVIFILIVLHLIKWISDYGYLLPKKHFHQFILTDNSNEIDQIVKTITKEHQHYEQYNVVTRLILILRYRNLINRNDS
ncbi:hypothetical protein [Macrococcus brunensis]|uniref:hypothetical protein n=1 Tax=Macrococcus brunensis TaxID=198483 RepID=UPI001EEFFF93|nr:hypothetical protein [Macrococcus brunensis]ULG72705.1 hypothetical protein MGG12_04080 [Macrococcus brunensis]